MREIVFLKEEYINWLLNTKVSSENIQTSIIIWTEQTMFIYFKTHTQDLIKRKNLKERSGVVQQMGGRS